MLRAVAPEFRTFCRRMKTHFGSDLFMRSQVVYTTATQIRFNPENLDIEKMNHVIIDAGDFITASVVPVSFNEDTGAYKICPTVDNVKAHLEINIDNTEFDKTEPLPDFKKAFEEHEKKKNRKRKFTESKITCCSEEK